MQLLTRKCPEMEDLPSSYSVNPDTRDYFSFSTLALSSKCFPDSLQSTGLQISRSIPSLDVFENKMCLIYMCSKSCLKSFAFQVLFCLIGVFNV